MDRRPCPEPVEVRIALKLWHISTSRIQGWLHVEWPCAERGGYDYYLGPIGKLPLTAIWRPDIRILSSPSAGGPLIKDDTVVRLVGGQSASKDYGTWSAVVPLDCEPRCSSMDYSRTYRRSLTVLEVTLGSYMIPMDEVLLTPITTKVDLSQCAGWNSSAVGCSNSIRAARYNSKAFNGRDQDIQTVHIKLCL